MKPSDIIAIATGSAAGTASNLPGLDSPMLQGALAAFLVYLGRAALVWAAKPAQDLSRNNAQKILCDTCPYRLPPGSCTHGPIPDKGQSISTKRRYSLRPTVPPPLGTTKPPGQTPHRKPASQENTADGKPPGQTHDTCDDTK